MNFDNSTFTFKDQGKYGNTSLGIGLVFIIAMIAGYFMDSVQFYQSYLLGYLFWLTLALGGLFFTLVNHLFGSEWNLVTRRINEAVMMSFELLAILFIPIILGMHHLFHWTDADAVAHDMILQAKAGYLNETFFIIRAVIYFGAWIIISRLLLKYSLKQDVESNEENILKLKRISAPGMVIYALTSSFASFDWIMSLNPHWYSTIYGVYIFAGSFLAILSFVIIFALYLRGKGVMKETITVEHYQDYGKLLLAFLVFWGYISFSQYFLMWYANIPEETIWYLNRWEGTWKIITMVIVIAGFFIPFLSVLTRAAKRNLSWLKLVAIWVFVMHLVDIYWLVVPTFSKTGATFSWQDIAAVFGIGGLFLWNFMRKYTSRPTIPVMDRRMEKSFHFKNV